MRRIHPALAVIVALAIALGALGALVTRPGPASARLTVEGTCEVRVRADGVERWQATDPAFCAAPVATPDPPTATPPPAGGACGESMVAWHPPVIDGCVTGHDHGDPPPRWIADAGYAVSYSGDFNTSALENAAKHAAMKGFSATLKGVDIYVRYHFNGTPADRGARYHSYEIWARDPEGGVSHWQGWLDAGDPATARTPRNQGDPGFGPRILVLDRASAAQGFTCEQWYVTTAGWSWDFGVTLCNPLTFFVAGEAASTPRDQWQPTGSAEGVRRLEASWYAFRQHPTGAFWATQFGAIVQGPADPACGQPMTMFGQTYKTVCLPQYIAPTMTEVAFPGNSTQHTFDTTGVQP
jgi:hypothetical protein